MGPPPKNPRNENGEKENIPDTSPEQRVHKTPRQFGQGPGLVEAPPVELQNFISELKSIENHTRAITPLFDDLVDHSIPECLSKLNLIIKSAAFLLEQHLEEKAKLPNLINSILDENKKKYEVVVVGLKESSDSQSTKRFQLDKEKVNQMLDIAEIEVEPTIFRMGPRREAGARPRPLKLVFPSSTLAGLFLKNRRNIKSNSNFGSLNIRESLSRDELQKRRLLNEECNKKNKELDNNDEDSYVIYANNIMRRSEINNYRKEPRKNY